MVWEKKIARVKVEKAAWLSILNPRLFLWPFGTLGGGGSVALSALSLACRRVLLSGVAGTAFRVLAGNAYQQYQ